MDIQAYIQSGIIESYVLGLASSEEVAEVDELSTQFAEVRQAVAEVSLYFEEQALESAIAPPVELKLKIKAAIKEEGSLKAAFIPPYADAHIDAAEVPVRAIRTWRIVAAASIILLISSAASNIYLLNKYKSKSDAYQALLSERNTLQANNKVYQTHLQEWQSAAEMMADPAMAMVKMKSVKGKDDAATVFWNTKNKDVYVMANKLPEPATGKQYQLWALVDGKPVDAGLLDPSCTSVCKMKNIIRADAFAITLEREGGSQTPTLKAMYVMAKV